MGAGRQRSQLTERIAVEAARLAAEQGHADLAVARRKAAEQLGVRDPRLWPDLVAVERQLRTQQRLFRGAAQAAALVHLRKLAGAFMADLQAFRPRLVGPVLEGTADVHSPVRLHLQADNPEAVIFALTDRHIPWRAGEVRLEYSRGRRQARPCLRLRAGETTVELVILDAADRDDPPLDPATGRPLRSADRAALEALAADQPPRWSTGT